MPLYEYQCKKCSKVWESFSSIPHAIMFETCQVCGGAGDRLYSLANVHVFPVFTTKNIMEDGTPVTVTGSGQLRQLEAEHGVKMADCGSPPQSETP
jgi:putative FmdB family regulatory protein